MQSLWVVSKNLADGQYFDALLDQGFNLVLLSTKEELEAEQGSGLIFVFTDSLESDSEPFWVDFKSDEKPVFLVGSEDFQGTTPDIPVDDQLTQAITTQVEQWLNNNDLPSEQSVVVEDLEGGVKDLKNSLANQKIQEKFDAIYGKDFKMDDQEDNGLTLNEDDLAIGEEESSPAEDNTSENAIEIDFSMDGSDDLEIENTGGSRVVAEDDEESPAAEEDEADIGLEFNTDEPDENPAENEAALPEETSDEPSVGGIELEFDTDSSSEEEASEPTEEPGSDEAGVEFSLEEESSDNDVEFEMQPEAEAQEDISGDSGSDEFEDKTQVDDLFDEPTMVDQAPVENNEGEDATSVLDLSSFETEATASSSDLTDEEATQAKSLEALTSEETEEDSGGFVAEEGESPQEDSESVELSFGEEEEDSSAEELSFEEEGQDEVAEVSPSEVETNPEMDVGSSETVINDISFGEEETSGAAETPTTTDIQATNMALEQAVAEEETLVVNSKELIKDSEATKAFHQEELLRLQASLRNLRDERESSLQEIEKARFENGELNRKLVNIQSDLDEVKIENTLLKQRLQDGMEELRYKARVAEDKKRMYEEKNKLLKEEFERLNHKVRVDFQNVREREKQLEGQLEMVKVDSSSQLQVREAKIQDLKRKIDTLEFNMENIISKEDQIREEKFFLEQKLDRVVKTLRTAMEIIESDSMVGDEAEVFRRLKNLG